MYSVFFVGTVVFIVMVFLLVLFSSILSALDTARQKDCGARGGEYTTGQCIGGAKNR